MVENYSFGYWVLRRRKALDLTRGELARQIGCASETIKKIERDERRPSLQIAALLANALAVPPEEQTLFLQVARGERSVDRLSLAPQPVQPLSEQTHNLPTPLPRLIGREHELETVEQLLANPDCRLLTLVGPGGIGKTHLALHLAERKVRAFLNGVWFVALAPLQSVDHIVAAIANTMGLKVSDRGNPKAQLFRYLRSKELLFVLDNFEHLIDSVTLVAELLRAAPDITVLVTSRERLHLQDEFLFKIDGLAYPANCDDHRPDQFGAVQLFVERAGRNYPHLAFSQADYAAITRICRLVEGMPLAVELAAAWTHLLSCQEIADEIEQGLSILAGSRRDVPQRHSSVRAVFDQSWKLLSEEEQVVLRGLSVFRGGFTREAAEQVSGASLTVLSMLADKSLLQFDQRLADRQRYNLHELVRQYASERLLEAGEDKPVRSQHLDFFLRWVEGAAPKVRGPQQLKWLDLLEADNDNLRAALEWSLAQAQYGEASLRLAGTLLLFWSRRGHMSEGRVWLSRALGSQNAPNAGAARAKASYVAGTLAHLQGSNAAKALLEESVGLWQTLGSAGKNGLAYALATLSESRQQGGDRTTARSLASEAVRLFREQDDRWGLAYALSSLGLAIRDHEDFALARSVLNESVAIWRDLGDLWGLKLATQFLGFVAIRHGDYEVAKRHFADCLAIARKLNDREAVAIALYGLGRATLNLSDRVQAKRYFAESYSLFGESDNKSWQADCLYCLGLLAQFEGDHEQAKIFHEQLLVLAHEVGPAWLRADALMGLAGVAAANGLASQAARLLGAADAQLEACTSYWDAAESRIVEQAVASAVAQLGEDAFAALRAEGRTMTFAQAAAYALEET